MVKFLSHYWLALILIATVLTRLPFLWSGYGADADAWLVANSASTLWNTGYYQESRLPGYPLHEIISAPLVGFGGAPLSNAATLIATLIAILVWNTIAQKIGNHKKLLVLAFAFTPVVWQNSAVTLDYVWSLLFIVLSLHEILRRQVLLAGIVLGIAVGFRPSNLAAVIPLLCLLNLQKQNTKQLLIFTLSVVTISVFAFVPLMMKYGIPGWFIATRQEMSDLHLQLGMRFISFFYRNVYFLGPLAAITMGYILWKGKDAILASLRSRDPIVVTSLVGVFTFLLLFLWLPLERAYLLPALPFLLLLIDKVATQKTFILFTIFLSLSAIVNFDVIDANDRRAFKFNVHPGMVIEEFMIREKLLKKRSTAASQVIEGKVIVMTGAGPVFWFENDHLETANNNDLQQTLFYNNTHCKLMQQKGNPHFLFAEYLTKAELDAVRNQNYEVFCLASAKNHVESVVGYTLESERILVK